MDDLLKEVGKQAPHCMMFADGTVQKGETLVDLETQMGLLQKALEPNGLRISREKTE